MGILGYIQNSSIGIILIVIMLFYAFGQNGRRQAQDSLFVSLLFSALVLLVLELLINVFLGSDFAGSRAFLTSIILLFYLLVPLPGALYFLYIDQLHKHWQRVPRQMGILVFIPSFLNAIFVLLSLYNGMIFTLVASNRYQRGRFFFLVFLISSLYMIGSYVHLIRRKRKHPAKSFSMVVAYPFPVIIAGVLQIHFEEMKVLGVSLAITLLMIFLHNQNTHANRDYLTSLYNRSLGSQYLQYLFQHKSKEKLIGGILIDFNGFKLLNDTYGHDMGDQSLRLFSKVLHESFSRDWLICRFGGDEFLIFSKLSSKQELDMAIQELQKNLSVFNDKEVLPTPLSISMGSAIVKAKDYDDSQAFISLLDERMYLDKKKYRS